MPNQRLDAAPKPGGSTRYPVEFNRRKGKYMGVQYPISVHVKPYSGNKGKLKQEYIRKIQTARRIEDYINSYMANCEGHIFMYGAIAAALELSTRTVHDILMPVCGGSNGITVDNPRFQKT